MEILLDWLRRESASVGLSLDEADLSAIAEIVGGVKRALAKIQFSEADGIAIPYSFDVFADRNGSSRNVTLQRFRSPRPPG